MIRDGMVWLDGGISDEIRLAAVADISRHLDSQVVIGLFLNPLPLPVAVDGDLAGAVATADLLDRARAGTRPRHCWPSDWRSLSGRPRSGGSMRWLTTSPILLPARRAPPTPLWRCVPMARWIPSGWSKAFCSDRAG